MRNLFLFSALILSLHTSAQIPIDSLLVYWSFDGNAKDNSGNGFTGSPKDALLSEDRFGFKNRAYKFTGPSQYISSSFPGISGTKARTFSWWFKQSSSNDGEDEWSMFLYGGETDGSGLGVMIFPSNIAESSNRIGIDIGNSYITYETKPVIGIWHHVVVTFNSNDGITVDAFKLYLDNVLLNKVATKRNDQVQIITGSGSPNLTIGGNSNYLPAQFLGAIDAFRVFNRAIDSKEVEALYSEGVCFSRVEITDTLYINTSITGYNPIEFSNTIKVWPNPAHDHITIDNGNFAKIKGCQIKITNALNQQVFESEIKQQQFNVDLSSWGVKGVYFLHFINGAGEIINIKKIILQ